MLTYEAARASFVSTQLLPHKITDPRVLQAFATVPREHYVGVAHPSLCYGDETLTVLPGRPLWPALFLARLLQEAHLKSTDHVLDIGFGTGYSSAILGQLGGRVTCLENDSTRLMPNLTPSGSCPLTTVYGPLEQGWPAAAPFDAILINGAVEMIPETLQGQVREDGRLIAFFRLPSAKIAQASLFHRHAQGWQRTAFFEADVTTWPEFRQQTGFQL